MVRLRSKTNRETERGSSGEPNGLGANPPVGECGGKDQVSHTKRHQQNTKRGRDCGREFTFTAGEQEFYAEKGFQNEPVRCRECRNNRKNASRNENREMYDAVCADCGAPTKVPFLPRNDKPIYCSACYAKHRAQR